MITKIVLNHFMSRGKHLKCLVFFNVSYLVSFIENHSLGIIKNFNNSTSSYACFLLFMDKFKTIEALDH